MLHHIIPAWRLRSVLLAVFLLPCAPAFACNEGNKLTDYMADWLLSSDEVRAEVVADYESSMKQGGFHVDGLKAKYKAFFGKRAVPIDELAKWGDERIIFALDAAIKQTSEIESAN